MHAALEQIDVECILFSVDYPYEQMDVAGRWFDDLVLDHEKKAKMGRENVTALFSLRLDPLSENLAAGFTS